MASGSMSIHRVTFLSFGRTLFLIILGTCGLNCLMAFGKKKSICRRARSSEMLSASIRSISPTIRSNSLAAHLIGRASENPR